MAFALGSAGALLKAFIPPASGLSARRAIAAAARKLSWTDGASSRELTTSRGNIIALSPAAEAALAALDLPPDGPIDLDAAPRARLTPEAAARNFVRWAQALELAGDYGTRSVYALYCEFSEVDGRPPVRDTRFLPALAETEGISAVAHGKDKGCRLWQWTIAAAKPIETVAEAISPDIWTHISAPASVQVPDATAAPPVLIDEAALLESHRATELEPTLLEAEPVISAALPAPASAQETALVSAPVAEAPPAVTYVVPANPRLPVRRKPDANAPAITPATVSAIVVDVRPARPAPVSVAAPSLAPSLAPELKSSASAIAAAHAAETSKARSGFVLPRFIDDSEHPFSPAGLREREKGARRLRINAAASRKQRGAVRRAA